MTRRGWRQVSSTVTEAPRHGCLKTFITLPFAIALSPLVLIFPAISILSRKQRITVTWER